MRITIIASGTRGDVQPAVALGKALQEHGYQIIILASPNFQAWIEGHGLTAVPASVNVQEVMASEGGQEWIEQGHKPLTQLRVMSRLLNKWGMEIATDAWQVCQGSQAIISSFTSDVYAVSIAEKLGVPQISMPLQPILMATRDGRSITSPAPRPNHESWLNYLFSKFLIEPGGWWLYGKISNRFRQEVLDLPPQSGRENTAARRQMLVLHAYSRHVTPPAADWPPNFHVTGYWFLDDEADWQPPPSLTHFLAAGAPPIYIGFGSMTNRKPAKITKMVVEAVRQSGQRAILLSGWAGLGAITLPDSIFQLDRVPHNWLFPQVSAVIHHGGAGTTGAGLRAGRPSVIVPHIADQFYWGQRIFALGVGPQALPRHQLSAEKLAVAIQQAVTDPTIQTQAEQLGRAIRAEDGLSQAVNLINQYLQD